MQNGSDLFRPNAIPLTQFSDCDPVAEANFLEFTSRAIESFCCVVHIDGFQT